MVKKSFILIFIIFLFFGAVYNVFGHEGVGGEITFEELGLSKPKLLPQSPLYFLKEWRRGFLKFFTFGRENKALIELKFINERAAEIKALEEKSEEERIAFAIGKYKEGVDELLARIAGFEESAQSPKTEDILSRVLRQFLEHEILFDELEIIDDLKVDVEEARVGLKRLTTEAIVKLEAPEKFKNRFERILKNQKGSVYNEVKAVYALNQLEDGLDNIVGEQIKELKEDLISKFEGHFKADPEEVASFLNSFLVRTVGELKTFDEIRERVTSGDLKSQLNLVRQNILRNDVNNISENESEEIINLAEKVLEELEFKVSSDDYLVSNSVLELLERANFHLEQAKELYGEGQYGVAFGQGTVSYAEAKNGLSQLVRSESEIEKDNFSLRIDFDRLVREAESKNITRGVSPKIYELFDRAEEVIINADTVVEVRDAKIILAEIEVLLTNGETAK